MPSFAAMRSCTICCWAVSAWYDFHSFPNLGHSNRAESVGQFELFPRAGEAMLSFPSEPRGPAHRLRTPVLMVS